MRLPTREPEDGECLLFCEYSRAKVIKLSKGISKYTIDVIGVGDITYKKTPYVYNNFLYFILGDVKFNEANRNMIVEEFIEKFWGLEK